MGDALRVVIADDEAIARKRLRRLLGALNGVELVGEVEGGRALLERLEEDDVDVVLLDIQMPDLSGLDAKALMSDEVRPYVVFTTAHAEYALEAFDVGVADYVLKPIEAGRLKTAFGRARRALGVPGSGQSSSRLAVSTNAGVVVLKIDDIRCAIWDGQLTTIHAEGQEVLSAASLQELANRLPDDRFFRVHRRVLLNLDHVAFLEPIDTGGYRAHTHDGLHVPVGRQAARRLRKLLGVR